MIIDTKDKIAVIKEFIMIKKVIDHENESIDSPTKHSLNRLDGKGFPEHNSLDFMADGNGWAHGPLRFSPFGVVFCPGYGSGSGFGGTDKSDLRIKHVNL